MKATANGSDGSFAIDDMKNYASSKSQDENINHPKAITLTNIFEGPKGCDPTTYYSEESNTHLNFSVLENLLNPVPMRSQDAMALLLRSYPFFETENLKKFQNIEDLQANCANPKILATAKSIVDDKCELDGMKHSKDFVKMFQKRIARSESFLENQLRSRNYYIQKLIEKKNFMIAMLVDGHGFILERYDGNPPRFLMLVKPDIITFDCQGSTTRNCQKENRNGSRGVSHSVDAGKFIVDLIDGMFWRKRGHFHETRKRGRFHETLKWCKPKVVKKDNPLIQYYGISLGKMQMRMHQLVWCVALQYGIENFMQMDRSEEYAYISAGTLTTAAMPALASEKCDVDHLFGHIGIASHGIIFTQLGSHEINMAMTHVRYNAGDWCMGREVKKCLFVCSAKREQEIFEYHIVNIEKAFGGSPRFIESGEDEGYDKALLYLKQKCLTPSCSPFSDEELLVLEMIGFDAEFLLEKRYWLAQSSDQPMENPGIRDPSRKDILFLKG